MEVERQKNEEEENLPSIETVDKLFEAGKIQEIEQIPMEAADATKIVTYMLALSSTSVKFEDRILLQDICFNILLSHGDVSGALDCALASDDKLKLLECIEICKDVKNCPRPERLTKVLPASNYWPVSARLHYGGGCEIEREAEIRRSLLLQLCLKIARHRLDITAADINMPSLESELEIILRRENLSKYFLGLATDLDVQEPRSTDTIFKVDQDPKKRLRGSALDSSTLALANAYVSGFVHAGFQKDVHLVAEGNQLIQKTKQHGVTGATAAMGLLYLWDVEAGLNQIDKFQYSSDTFIRAGAILGFGLNSCNVLNICDPALSLISDSLSCSELSERLAAYMSLGYAYVGTAREEIRDLLVPVMLDLETLGGLEASAAAAFTLGLTFVGTADESITEALLQTLIERAELAVGIDSIQAFNFAIALALLYLQKGDQCEVVLAGLAAITHPIGKFAHILTEACAYAGTGDVIKVQEFLQTCVTQVNEIHCEADEEAPMAETEPEKPTMVEAPAPDANAAEAEEGEVNNAGTVGAQSEDQADGSGAIAKVVREDIQGVIPGLAVLALPLITLREEIGNEMLFRLFNHLLQFDGFFVRRAVPIALAIHSASNPRPAVVELLSKLSHDPDADTALHAILALGIVAGGTNNARVAQLLRQLASYYAVDANALFLVRLAQGLVFCGKGLHSFSPLHTDRRLIDRNALAGLIAFSVQALFTKDTLCQGRYHMNIYHLVPAIHPRWLITVDESLKPVFVTVRVGHAVETAGAAGQPKSITGFRTHETPVLLAYDEKAEIGTSDWQPMTEILEGIVVVRRLTGRDKVAAAKALD